MIFKDGELNELIKFLNLLSNNQYTNLIKINWNNWKDVADSIITLCYDNNVVAHILSQNTQHNINSFGYIVNHIKQYQNLITNLILLKYNYSNNAHTIVDFIF